jgi:hypothetical protein
MGTRHHRQRPVVVVVGSASSIRHAVAIHPHEGGRPGFELDSTFGRPTPVVLKDSTLSNALGLETDQVLALIIFSV